MIGNGWFERMAGDHICAHCCLFGSPRDAPRYRDKDSARSIPRRGLVFFVIISAFASSIGGWLAAGEAGGADPFYPQLLDEGTYAYRSGDLVNASECLRIAAFGVLDDRPRLAACYLYLALVYHQLKIPEMAARYVRSLSTMQASDVLSGGAVPPEVLRSYDAIARIYDRPDQPGGAGGSLATPPTARNGADLEAEIESMREAIKKDPSNSENYLLLSDRLHQLRKTDDACDVLDGLLKRDPRNGRAHLELGKLMVEKKKYYDAVIDLCKAAEHLPEEVEAWFALGIAYVELKDMPHAQQCFSKALRINSDYKDLRARADRVDAFMVAQHDKAMALHDRAMKEASLSRRVDILKQALELAPKEPRILTALSNAHADRHEYEAAASTLEACIAIQPEKGELYVRAADLWTREGDLQKALAVLRNTQRIESAIVEVQYQTGRLLLQEKRYPEAVVELRKVISADPRYKDAQRLYDMAQRSGPSSPSRPGGT